MSRAISVLPAPVGSSTATSLFAAKFAAYSASTWAWLGQSFRNFAELRRLRYLDPDAAAFLRRVADEQGTEVERIVNAWIRKDIDLIKSVS